MKQKWQAEIKFKTHTSKLDVFLWVSVKCNRFPQKIAPLRHSFLPGKPSPKNAFKSCSLSPNKKQADSLEIFFTPYTTVQKVPQNPIFKSMSPYASLFTPTPVCRAMKLCPHWELRKMRETREMEKREKETRDRKRENRENKVWTPWN